MNKNTLKSVAAVLAGFIAVVVLSLGTDAMMHAVGVFPQFGQPMSDALFLLSTLYRTVYCIAGSYIAAQLAPDRPMGHALALGVVGLVVSTVGAVVTMEQGAGLRAALVSYRSHHHRHPVRLAGRQTPRHAVAHALSGARVLSG